MIVVNPKILDRLTGNFASAMAIWPFIILRDKKYLNDPILINHEKIHLRQQLELLILFFYLWYALEFLFYRIRGLQSGLAYRKIRFEREAYLYEHDLDYLKRRRWYAFLKVLYVEKK